MENMIVITTDFGDRFSLMQIVGVIKSIHPESQVMIGENRITPFSIVEGAFVVRESSKFLPKGTIHLSIIDPGVGGVRKPIVIEGEKFSYVGPDNGLFWPSIEQDGFKAAYEIRMETLGNASNTFHGRDVFAKAAAFVVANRPFEEYTRPLKKEDLVELHFKDNQVVFIDPYGNVKVNNPANYQFGQVLTVTTPTGKIVSVPFQRTFVDVPIHQPVSYKGSNDTLELAVHKGSFEDIFAVNVEDVLSISTS